MDTKKYLTRTLSDIIANAVTDRTFYANPWLAASTINMLFAPTGMGKSHWAFHLALKIAQGSEWLGARTKQARVIYIDGEMGGQTWLSRIPDQMMLNDISNNFAMVCPEHFKDLTIPTMADPKNLKTWLETLKDYDVIFIDNYITCCMPLDARMTDIDIFLKVKDLLVTLKGMGKAIVLIHHTNKGGQDQHGTVYKDVIMDTIFRLRQFPEQYLESGLSWEISVLKDRHNFFKGNLEHLVDFVYHNDGVQVKYVNLELARWNFIHKNMRHCSNADFSQRLGVPISEIKRLFDKYKPADCASDEDDLLI